MKKMYMSIAAIGAASILIAAPVFADKAPDAGDGIQNPTQVDEPGLINPANPQIGAGTDGAELPRQGVPAGPGVIQGDAQEGQGGPSNIELWNDDSISGGQPDIAGDGVPNAFQVDNPGDIGSGGGTAGPPAVLPAQGAAPGLQHGK